LNDNDVQIEVESSVVDNVPPALADDDDSVLNNNNLPVEIDNISESEEQFDLPDIPLDDYQLTRDRERRPIRPPVRLIMMSLFHYLLIKINLKMNLILMMML